MSSSNKSSNTSKSSNSNTLDSKSLFYMALLAIQFGMQPTLTRKFTPQGICRSTVILMQEVTKLILAYTMLNVSGGKQAAFRGWNIQTWIQVAMVPAALYALQNIAALQAYQNLDPLTFNVLNQTKTLSAALCCYLVMGRKQSLVQVFSLFLLLFSALIMEKVIPLDTITAMLTGGDGSLIGEKLHVPELDSNHWTKGVAPIMLASFISGLSGALSQKNLQSHGGGRNPYLFSMELCVASILLLSGSFLFSQDGKTIKEEGFWTGWTPMTFIPILTNSIGGIIVGLVTKYAGSVRKGFALILGMFLSGVVQASLQPDVGVSKEQAIGGILAAASLYMHATNPHIPKSKPKTD